MGQISDPPSRERGGRRGDARLCSASLEAFFESADAAVVISRDSEDFVELTVDGVETRVYRRCHCHEPGIGFGAVCIEFRAEDFFYVPMRLLRLELRSLMRLLLTEGAPKDGEDGDCDGDDLAVSHMVRSLCEPRSLHVSCFSLPGHLSRR